MYSKVTKDGITLVALKLYFNDKNMIKIEVATAQGKKLHDKREDLKEKSLKRESEQALKSYTWDNFYLDFFMKKDNKICNQSLINC